jgi:pSer/pThr/pTyr-binding forkhead associated (FHA) protein
MEIMLMESKTYGELTPLGGGDPIPLLKRKITVGRRNSCEVTLRFPNVSSHHCELELINGYWHVKDLNSSNGIRVNSSRCDQKFLFPGDVLAVGKHKFEVSYEAQGERPQEEENVFGTSLMEKAGLVKTQRSKARRKSSDEVDKDDDIALQWILGKE